MLCFLDFGDVEMSTTYDVLPFSRPPLSEPVNLFIELHEGYDLNLLLVLL